MQDIYQIAKVRLTYKSKVKASERPIIRCSQDMYKLLINSVYDPETIEHHESLKLILMNRAGRVLGIHTVSIGGTGECSADIKIMMQAAILANATGIILCHNHPSGNLSSSTQDELLTQRVSKVCKLMDMNLLDHIIITSESYFSFADSGKL